MSVASALAGIAPLGVLIGLHQENTDSFAYGQGQERNGKEIHCSQNTDGRYIRIDSLSKGRQKPGQDTESQI